MIQAEPPETKSRMENVMGKMNKPTPHRLKRMTDNKAVAPQCCLYVCVCVCVEWLMVNDHYFKYPNEINKKKDKTRRK